MAATSDRPRRPTLYSWGRSPIWGGGRLSHALDRSRETIYSHAPFISIYGDSLTSIPRGGRGQLSIVGTPPVLFISIYIYIYGYGDRIDLEPYIRAHYPTPPTPYLFYLGGDLPPRPVDITYVISNINDRPNQWVVHIPVGDSRPIPTRVVITITSPSIIARYICAAPVSAQSLCVSSRSWLLGLSPDIDNSSPIWRLYSRLGRPIYISMDWAFRD